ncbi:COG1470 family protein [Paenibacillus chungangensis]|uniref:NEW3 domain-containing protein n=1 Tax=Paenibacillus chungangensis TaxID=696535 RepID=A0ABW3HY00_9BACL
MRSACRNVFMLVFICTFLIGTSSWLAVPKAAAAGDLALFTPYLELYAEPGESIHYSIEVINSGDTTQMADIGFRGEGNDWAYELTAGSRIVRQIAVKSNSAQTLSLRLDVPLEVEKGEYRFTAAAGSASLPLKVYVSEKGTYRTAWEAEQANVQGHADSSFTFSTTLRNQTAEEQTYSLDAGIEPGWEVRFKSGGSNVASVTIDPNGSQSISVEVAPPDRVEAGTYAIPIRASNSSTSAETTLEAVITGTYGVSLGTKDERLNTSIKAGGNRTMELIVSNTGTTALEEVSMSASAPANWEVTFEPKTIASIPPGESATVQAIVTSDKKSLPGDYALNLTASSPQKQANAAIRVAVESSLLWGWIGVIIIAAVIAVIYGLFRRYGRR